MKIGWKLILWLVVLVMGFALTTFLDARTPSTPPTPRADQIEGSLRTVVNYTLLFAGFEKVDGDLTVTERVLEDWPTEDLILELKLVSGMHRIQWTAFADMERFEELKLLAMADKDGNILIPNSCKDSFIDCSTALNRECQMKRQNGRPKPSTLQKSNWEPTAQRPCTGICADGTNVACEDIGAKPMRPSKPRAAQDGCMDAR